MIEPILGPIESSPSSVAGLDNIGFFIYSLALRWLKDIGLLAQNSHNFLVQKLLGFYTKVVLFYTSNQWTSLIDEP